MVSIIGYSGDLRRVVVVASMVSTVFIGSHAGSGTVVILAIIVAVVVVVLVCGILNLCYVRRKSLLLSLLSCYGLLLCSG